jgi:hypothetical protein
MAATDTAQNGTAAAKDSEKKSSRRQRQMKSISTMSATSEMNKVDCTYRVEKTQSDWTDLGNFEPFCLSPDGGYLYVKSSKSSYICLNQQSQETGIAVGRVYRVYL